MSDSSPKILVLGHNGMVGSAILRVLNADQEVRVLTCSRNELDLLDQSKVHSFFEKQRPSQVYLAAAKVGGIHANDSFPAEFIYQNLMIQANVIHAAFMCDVDRLLFLGSSCIYPCNAAQPMQERALLTGALEATNEPYAIAKIAGIKMCESYNRQYDTDFRSVMPTNLYGPGDNYHPENSHVIPGLIRRIHAAKCAQDSSVTVWGSGSPLREFLFVDDMARACVHVMNLKKAVYDNHTQKTCSHINVGCSEEISIAALAAKVKEIVGFTGELVFDETKPDGMSRKLMDSTRLNALGWEAEVSLDRGLMKTYEAFLQRGESC